MNHTTAPRGWLFALVARYPRTILALALLLSVASLVLTKTRMEFLTGRDDLMPRNAPFQLEYRAYREIFGDQDDIVVVAESTDAELTMRFCDTLHERLTKDSSLYREVFYPGGLPFFRQNGLLFAQLEDIQNLRRTLSMAAPVLKDLAASPSVQTLFTSLTRQINDYLANPDPASMKSLTFMLTTLDKGFKGFDGKSATLSMDGFLKGGGGAKPSQLETAGRQQIITVLPMRDETSFAPAEKTIVKMRGEVQTLLKKPEFKGISAGLTGVPVLEYEEMATSQRDMGIATGLSLTLTVILLLIAFRGLLNVIAAMVSLIVAICVSFGFATIAVGHLNILSMVFAVMLIGLGIEYSIQVVLRYQEELGRGVTHNEAIDTGLSRNLFSIIMAAATVALAFITFVFTDFKGIAELGVIAAGGIVICVISTFTVLPAMLVLMERFRKPAESAGHNRPVQKTEQTTFLKDLFNRPKLVIAVTLIAVLAAIYPLGRSSFDYNMMNLQAKGLESVTYAYKLMRSKENSGYFGVAIARDRTEAAILTERLEKLSSVDHVVSLLALVPADQDAKLAELANLRRVMDTV
ncbi:MAG: MMPL family transporter, partial [Deltaproteobacteria bacterium]